MLLASLIVTLNGLSQRMCRSRTTVILRPQPKNPPAKPMRRSAYRSTERPREAPASPSSASRGDASFVSMTVVYVGHNCCDRPLSRSKASQQRDALASAAGAPLHGGVLE